MCALLERQVARYRDDVVFDYLTDDDSHQQLTFAQLDRRARAIGAQLAARMAPGDRALLVYPAGLEFIAAFFGCLYAGVVATPTTYPKPRRPLHRTSRIAIDSGATVALTTRQTLDAIDFDQQDDVTRALDWIASDDLRDAHLNWRPVRARGDDLAFLQYTSGSTSEPKGVMVTHGNLLANLEAIRRAFGLPRERDADAHAGVFWLPAYHDMGLIGGVLTPLYVGGPTLLMSPASFLQRPLRWLDAISEYRGTISGAPSFAYEYCVRRIPEEQRERLDLSCWRLAFCGAEPISAATLREFAEAFAPAGFQYDSFYPCYGLAESTLLAAGPHHENPPTVLTVDRTALREHRVEPSADDESAQPLVGCGSAPRAARVEIVDPETAALLPDGSVGEIVLQGPSVAQGYWRRSEETREVFLAKADGLEGRFLRTGDLGFVHEGELYVTGRIKDVVILRGRNYYPQDIEETAVAAHPAVLPGAAFAVEDNGKEELVVAHQVDRACRKDDRAAVVEAVRRAILQEHEVDPLAVVLIRQTSLPVTSSGKVQRALCRRQYEQGHLKVVHEWRRQDRSERAGADLPAPSLEGLTVDDAAEKILEWLEAWLVAQTEISTDALYSDKPFADLGVDSLTGVELSYELEEAFGVPLPPVVAWNHPTPAALSRYLAEQALGVGREAETPQSGANDIESLLDDIENLSDEEAERLLNEE